MTSGRRTVWSAASVADSTARMITSTSSVSSRVTAVASISPSLPRCPSVLRLGLLARAHARGHPDPDVPLGHVLRHDGARGGRGVLPDLHRRAEQAVRPDERVVADLRPVLSHTVVVQRDHAGAYVHALADVGVSDVAEVMHLRVAPQPRVLHLAVIPHLDAGLEVGARTQMRERTDAHAILERCALEHRRFDLAVRAHGRVAN